MKPGRKTGIKCGYKNFICVFPGLKKWMRDNNCSASDLADAMFMTLNAFYRKLNGDVRMNMDDVKTIMHITGMTFEQAFGEELSKADARLLIIRKAD